MHTFERRVALTIEFQNLVVVLPQWGAVGHSDQSDSYKQQIQHVWLRENRQVKVSALCKTANQDDRPISCQKVQILLNTRQHSGMTTSYISSPFTILDLVVDLIVVLLNTYEELKSRTVSDWHHQRKDDTWKRASSEMTFQAPSSKLSDYSHSMSDEHFDFWDAPLPLSEYLHSKMLPYWKCPPFFEKISRPPRKKCPPGFN